MFRKKQGRKCSIILGFLLLFSIMAGYFPLTGADAAPAFTDVPDDSYYYSAVVQMASQGVVSGYGDGTFGPQDPVKNAEAVKLVCGMAGIDTAGYTGQSSPWYIDVWTWAQDNGIVPAGTDAEAYATRAQICGYIAAAYRMDTSSTETNVFSDTDSQIANTLYDYGVIVGIDNGDGTVSFGGEENVKRCDTCVMLSRLAEKVAQPQWPAVEKKPTRESYTLDKSHYAVSKPVSFSSYDDYIGAWNYMLANKVTDASFTLGSNYSERQLRSLIDTIQSAYYYAAFDYMEYAAFLNQWGVGVSGGMERNGRIYAPVITLQLRNGVGLSLSETLGEISTFEKTCDNIVTQIYADGSLKSSMSVKEKAYVLYRYVVLHTKYDESVQYYNGYDAAVRGTAVCQGYTSMYNYLCNIAGVPMRAMTGDVGNTGHAWSRTYQNGVYYNVDTTWGDTVPDQAGYCDDTWFWVSDEYLKTCSTPRSFDIDSMSEAA